MHIALVAAVGRNGEIGRDNDLLWRTREDQQRFRSTTLGHPVVMGRRTWDSLPERFRPLPGRRNIVVTRNPAWSADGAEAALSLDAALALAGTGACAEALQSAREDQLEHRVRQPARRRADRKHDDRPAEHGARAEAVGHPAAQGDEHGER